MNQEQWRKAKEIYQSFAGREPLQRDAYLAAACAGDELLRKEVESLIACQSEADGLMATPALEVAVRELAAEPEMDLSGRMVLHYQVKEQIGAGGMGIVYRAFDTRLHRDVAMKALPAVFSADRERVARFEREARSLATLSHPNVAAIYGLEEWEGRRFIVMELAEGQTLAERLGRGPLPVEEALDVCRRIAEGVEAAHDKGIIHRDLKPANVKVTPEGKVKVLDFGLAKAFLDEPSVTDPLHSPTLTDPMSHPGVILGTAAYMSPEQAKGRTLDRRTDIWAFGCILCECLTGKRVFQGDTASEVIASILKSEPEWIALPVETPATVRTLLRRCLQKNPDLRLHDIADARIEIAESTDYPTELAPVSRRFLILWLASGAAFMLFAGMLFDRCMMKLSSSAPGPSVEKRIIKVEPGLWLDGFRGSIEAQRPNRTAMAISRNGEFIVYSAIPENPDAKAKPQLYLRTISLLDAKPIAGSEGAVNPFLSPDDRWVGYWADGRLMRVPVGGGVPAKVCDAASIYGASWGIDNTIVFAPKTSSGLKRVSADGGTPEELTIPDPKREERSHRLPYWLPNGNGVLFTIMRDGVDMQPRIAVLDLKTRQWRTLYRDASDARFCHPGYLLFLQRGTLMAGRFDAERMEIAGQPYPVAQNVMQALSGWNTDYHSGAGQFALSESGSIVYATGGILPPHENSLVWVDQRGTEQPVLSRKFPYFSPRLSPDGKRIVYSTGGNEWQIWVYDIGTDTNSRLTSEGGANFPIWSPDGTHVAFSLKKSTVPNLFWQPWDGSLQMERLTTSDSQQYLGSWSHDSKIIALVENHPGSVYHIALLDMKSGKVSPFLTSQYGQTYPEISPDGRWIAYVSNESGKEEIYVMSVSGTGGKWTITNDGGTHPLWARNGKQLFYWIKNQLWAVDILPGNGFSIENRRMLFDRAGYALGGPVRGYDVSLDSQRFLMVKREQCKPTPVTEMILVRNWPEELKLHMPTGNK